MEKIIPWLMAACLCPAATFAASSVGLTLDPQASGAVISTNFLGLSYEMALACPASNGEYFFSPANRPLINLFETLGIQSLRVGGNTADRTTVKIPDQADIDSLFAFARAAGVKVIYTLRLNESDPVDAAQTAKYIMDNYRPELTCFTLGNEPDKLVKDSAAYCEALSNYLAVITAPTNAPDAVFSGPNTTQGAIRWARDFAGNFTHNPHVILVTQHEYPAGSARVATNALTACEKLLSTNLPNVYERVYDAFVPAVRASGFQYRLEEANSFSNGGAAGASDAFASALWGLDYLYWWAGHGASGINFHTGGYVGATRPPGMKYVVFWNSPEGFAVRPLGYAVKAFNLGGHGRWVPVHFKSNTDQINLTAYGVLAGDGSCYITLINKETVRTGDVNLTITPGSSFARGQVMFLTAPGNDITATTGVTLGGAPIKDNGSWSGTWTSLAAPLDNGHFSVEMPAASAAIIRLTQP